MPGAHDQLYDDVSSDLIDRLLDGVDILSEKLPSHYNFALSTLRMSLSKSGPLNCGHLSRTSLMEAFKTIEEQPLILHMERQNAAILLRLNTDAR